MKVISETWRVR